MKIVSWNVNGIRACYKKTLEGFVRSTKADILCLQETKAHPDQLNDEIKTVGGSWSAWAWAKRKGYSGVVTYSAQQPRAHQVGLGIELYDDEGRVVITDHEDFLLYNIYFPNGQSGDERQKYKMHFNNDLLKHLKEKIKEGREIVVLGDYNIAPQEIDIYDPKKFASTSGFLSAERKWFEHFLEVGFVDTFRHLHGNEPDRYSWWNLIDRSRLGNRGWRIDLICVSKGLVPKIKSADILDNVEGSDHCPVVLELKL